MFEVTVEQHFSAAHLLRNYPGKCAQLHGHNYKVQVTIEGPALDSLGMLVEFEVIKKALAPWIDRFDHGYLNEIPPFDQTNPTAENLAKFFWEVVDKAIRQPGGAAEVKVACVRVLETDKCSAAYRP
ncbi:MAG: 6-carboxytetrahydropterin synthase QueD [Bryobacter sp.]|nr:6-carboxytetrahydropterin synthase QueD [Bryobacter sp.]